VSAQLLLKKRLSISATLTLLAGVVASTAVFLTASPDEQNSLVTEFRNSKAYRHELEAYGGKLSLAADELSRWFNSLWKGENLAFTIAAASAAIACLLYFTARRIHTASSEQTDKTPDTK